MKLVSGSDEQSQQVMKEETQAQETTDQTQSKESEKQKPPRPKGVRISGQPHKFRERSKLEARTQDERVRERRDDWRGQIEYENNWKDKGRREKEGERRVTERRAEIRRKGLVERRIKPPRPGRASDNKSKFVQPEGTVEARLNAERPEQEPGSYAVSARKMSRRSAAPIGTRVEGDDFKPVQQSLSSLVWPLTKPIRIAIKAAFKAVRQKKQEEQA